MSPIRNQTVKKSTHIAGKFHSTLVIENLVYFFFSTIPDFIMEVKEEIREQCSIYFRQVEAFLENFLCSSNRTLIFF